MLSGLCAIVGTAQRSTLGIRSNIMYWPSSESLVDPFILDVAMNDLRHKGDVAKQTDKSHDTQLFCCQPII